MRGANARLEDHQRVWSTSIWPGDALPRTEGTQKLKRREIQRWAAGEHDRGAGAVAARRRVEDVVARFAAGRDDRRPDTTLDELGLSSLDRVELMMALEEAFQTTLDEADARRGARPSAISRRWSRGRSGGPQVRGPSDPRVRRAGAGPSTAQPDRTRTRSTFPSWNRSRLSWFLRRISLPTWILPLGRLFMTVEGRRARASRGARRDRWSSRPITRATWTRRRS